MRLIACFLSFTVAALLVRSAEPKPETNMTNAASISARDSRITYMGRVALAGDEARMGFSGITVRFVYRRPAPVLRLHAGSDNCYFNLACNGWDPVVIHLKPGENEIALPTGVAPAGTVPGRRQLPGTALAARMRAAAPAALGRAKAHVHR